MKRTSKLFALALFLFMGAFNSGCAGIQRSRSSGYADRDFSDPTFGRDRKASEREEALNQMGLAPDRDLSEKEADAVASRVALAKVERNLEGRREREQYFRNKPYMKSDRDRLQFLGLDSFEARQRWLNAKNINPTSTQHSAEMQYLIDTNDISVGMTKQAVKESWGEPDLVEVAGNPLYGNERWHYSEQNPSTEGYQTQKRMVYFDSGRVSGWESR